MRAVMTLSAAVLAAAALLAGGRAAHAQAAPAGGRPAANTLDTTILLPQEIDSIRAGHARRGRLEAGDWTMGDGTYADIWYLRGQPGQRVTITLQSRDFEVYVQLLDASGTRLADDDGGGGGRTARITFALRTNERYQIVVNNYRDEPQVGVYTLEVRSP